jgi:hypothetical protein
MVFGQPVSGQKINADSFRPAEMPNFDNGQEIGEFRSHVRDFTFYAQDETLATGFPIGDDGVWSAGQWPENQCRFFELLQSRE